MNDFSMTIPFITTDIDAPTAKAADSSAPASDDFASMLAAVWCAPVVTQQSPSVVDSGATSKAAIDSIGSDAQTDQTGLINAPIQLTVSVDSDLPIDGVSCLRPESVEKELDLPEVSLPISKAGPYQTDSRENLIRPNSFVELATSGLESSQTRTTSTVSRPTEFVQQSPGPITDHEVDNLNPTPVPSTDVVVSVGQHLPSIRIDQGPITVSVGNALQKATNRIVTDQVASEAIRREANIVASYLAESTRDDREISFDMIKIEPNANAQESRANPFEPKLKMTNIASYLGESTRDNRAISFDIIKTELGANSQESRANSDSLEGLSDNKGKMTSVTATSTSFASVLKTQSGPAGNQSAEAIAPQITNQIVDLAATTSARQPRSVRLRLRPEELGQVEVQLTRDSSGKLSAQLSVERENTRAVLLQSLPELRETLERAGITVEQLQVTSETTSFAHDGRDTRQQSAYEVTGSSFSKSDSINEPETQSKERVREHKLLSLSA